MKKEKSFGVARAEHGVGPQGSVSKDGGNMKFVKSLYT
jgi:hypothetical protein